MIINLLYSSNVYILNKILIVEFINCKMKLFIHSKLMSK